MRGACRKRSLPVVRLVLSRQKLCSGRSVVRRPPLGEGWGGGCGHGKSQNFAFYTAKPPIPQPASHSPRSRPSRPAAPPIRGRLAPSTAELLWHYHLFSLPWGRVGVGVVGDARPESPVVFRDLPRPRAPVFSSGQTTPTGGCAAISPEGGGRGPHAVRGAW